jgi:hypothetical protein
MREEGPFGLLSSNTASIKAKFHIRNVQKCSVSCAGISLYCDTPKLDSTPLERGTYVSIIYLICRTGALLDVFWLDIDGSEVRVCGFRKMTFWWAGILRKFAGTFQNYTGYTGKLLSSTCAETFRKRSRTVASCRSEYPVYSLTSRSQTQNMIPTTNLGVLQWVSSCEQLCQPEKVVWCDGSQKEYDNLCRLLVEKGTFIKLNEDLRPNSYVARTSVTDSAVFHA